MKMGKAFNLLKEGKLKNGDVVKWQGLYNTDAKCFDGGYLYIVENGKIIGKSIRNAQNRKEAIGIYRQVVI